MRVAKQEAIISRASLRFPKILLRRFRVTENMSNSPRLPLNPTALPLVDAARALSQVGGEPITEAMLRADVDAGAPTNADGTLNLVHFAAWLAKQMGHNAGDANAD
jgi:hypothetical protein